MLRITHALVGSVILSAYLGSPCIVLLDAAAMLSELLPDPCASFDRDPPSGSAASNDLDRDRVLLIRLLPALVV